MSVKGQKKKCPKTFYLQGFQTLSIAGDERIELPPKVLETPIIPFDQSPISYYKTYECMPGIHRVEYLNKTHLLLYRF